MPENQKLPHYQVLMQERKKIAEELEKLDIEYDKFDGNDLHQHEIYLQMKKVKNLLKKNKEDYYESLPRVIFSECPYTHESVTSSFDPSGFSGLWWMASTRKSYDLTVHPKTFRLLRGAVNLQHKKPFGGPDAALVGPGVPYVIPRILNLPTMKMVISQITMDNGYLVYPMAYFSSEMPTPGQLTSAWLEQDQYYFHDAQGNSRWRVANDAWDFDIGKWIEVGKVCWMMPGATHLAATSTTPADCPYVNLDGVRGPQRIKDDRLSVGPLPDPDSDEDPFD